MFQSEHTVFRAAGGRATCLLNDVVVAPAKDELAGHAGRCDSTSYQEVEDAGYHPTDEA